MLLRLRKIPGEACGSKTKHILGLSESRKISASDYTPGALKKMDELYTLQGIDQIRRDQKNWGNQRPLKECKYLPTPSPSSSPIFQG